MGHYILGVGLSKPLWYNYNLPSLETRGYSKQPYYVEAVNSSECRGPDYIYLEHKSFYLKCEHDIGFRPILKSKFAVKLILFVVFISHLVIQYVI